MISEAGIECDPEKTASISSWPRPKTLKDVRTFCGLASYYRAFVPGFAKIAQPLHSLTRKNATFLWTDACEQAFQEHKARLTKPPVLVAPNDEGQYVLDTDASDFALGAVLQQYQPDGTLRVIAYGSRALTAPERRYCITRKELLGVVFGLKKYRQHLLGREILVRTDHAALTYLKRTPEPIGQQGRWLDLIAEFDITRIEHRPGRVHSNSDALSRRPCERDEEEPCQQCLRGTTAGRAYNKSPENDSDETDLDPDYLPGESVDSQSETDSEDEYIEERARRARGRPMSPAKPGEGAMVPVTAVKQEPVDDRAPHWALIPDTSTVPGSSLNGTGPRWSSIMDADESSDAGAAAEIPSWASESQPPGIAPHLEPMSEQSGAAAPRLGLMNEQSAGLAPRLEPVNEPTRSTSSTLGQPDLITVESADGVREEYIIKSEVASSEDETEASLVQQLSQGNAMATTAIPVGDSVNDSDGLFTRDELREAQQNDDGVRIAMEFVQKGVPPDRAEIRTIPEDANSLLLQFESLQIRDGILYRRFQHPDGTTKYWQLVFPVSLRREYIQRLHADLDTLDRLRPVRRLLGVLISLGGAHT